MTANDGFLDIYHYSSYIPVHISWLFHIFIKNQIKINGVGGTENRLKTPQAFLIPFMCISFTFTTLENKMEHKLPYFVATLGSCLLGNQKEELIHESGLHDM